MTECIYEKLGVDPMKRKVRNVFAPLVKNDFPGMFANIIRHPWFEGGVIAKHPDGSGSKSIQRCLHYFETGDESVFKEDPYDALQMNLGDIAACGLTNGPVYFTQTIGINSNNVPKGIILGQIASGIAELKNFYKRHNITIELLSGETADLPDQINSYDLNMDVYSEGFEHNLIKGNVRPGDRIWGFSSGGKAPWERKANSGCMSNGSTLLRIVLMHPEYAGKYPFLTRKDKPFSGRFRVNDYHDRLGMTVSEAILSPTRQWSLVIKMIIDKLKERGELELLHGISMNTGGGATKIMHVGRHIVYVKDSMPEFLPIFKLAQEESGETDRNMFRTFNCGIGIDIVGSDYNHILSDVLTEVGADTSIPVYEIGYCDRYARINPAVRIRHNGKWYSYYK